MYEFRSVSPRIAKMAKAIRDRTIIVDAERTTILTDAYKKHDHVIPAIKIPMATLETCQRVTVRIEPDEIIVGNLGKNYCGTGHTPSWGNVYWVIDAVDSGEWPLGDDGYYHTRPGIDGFPHAISVEDVALFKQSRDYWQKEKHGLDAMAEAWQPDGFKEMRECECSDYAPGLPMMICAVGHLTAGFKKIIDVGYGAIRKQAQDWMDQREGDLMGQDMNKYIFYKSVTIACDAATTLINRYGDEADRQARECTDPVRKAELERMADSLHWISTNPARNFWEAVQGTMLYQVFLYLDSGFSPSCSFGRFDQYTWPYLQRDLQSGALTLDQAQEIVDAFFLKAHTYVGVTTPEQSKVSGNGVTYQHTTIGGVDPDTGLDASNPVTYMVLETLCRLQLHDPPISLRIHSDTPNSVWDLALTTSKLIGGLPLFQNDDLIIPSLQQEMGFTLHDARDYSLIGCQEIVGSGCDYPAACGVHPPHASVWFGVLLDMAINDGVNPKNGKQGKLHTGYLYEMQSFEQVKEAFASYVKWALKWHITMNNYSEYVTQWVSPHAALSISMDDCMEKGLDATLGGCRYNSYGGTAPGLATIADSLTTIRYMCFDHDYCTTRELYDAVMANWEGYEELRQRIVNEVPHFGNADPYADEQMKWVMDLYVGICGQGYSTRSKKYKAGLYGASDHIAQGYRTWATPDGRRDNEPLSDAASPAQGRDCCGPTAIFSSMLAYDQAKIMDGMALNMRLHPSVLGDQSGFDKVRDMTRTYFENGGLEVQYNVVSTDKLRAAQADPDSYRNLVVRIAGFSAYFVEMGKNLQDDIISRNEEHI